MEEKDFVELKKKFKDLPDFSVLDFEFEISSIEKSSFPLRDISGNIQERINDVLQLLADILQPDTGSFVQFHECTVFSENDKRVILDLYKKIMLLYKDLLLCDLSLNDNDLVKTIVRISKDWPLLRKEILPIIEKTKSCWEKSDKAKQILNYLG